MKKYIITCVATIFGVFFAQADNINVQDVTMDVGQSGTIDICLTNTATNYVSFQMDLYLPDGFTLNKTGNTLSSRFSNGELTIGKQSDGAFRLMGTSLPLNPITGTDGVLITLSVNAPATVTSGTANINNIRFATRQSEKTTMADVSFTMTAIGNQSLSLSSLPTMTYGDTAYTLPSETDQGLSLSWSIDDTSVATVSGNTLTIKGAGTATVTATQAGNNLYNAFSKEYTLTIEKAQLTITAKDATMVYGGEQPAFEATYDGFKYNEDANVLTKQPSFNSSATSSSAIGTYDINVSGAEAQNYSFDYVKGTLTITAKGASNLTIGDIAEQTYTGSALTPAITVKDGTTTLTNGTDYTVAYSNNTNAGTATVTVTGKGNYTGTKTATFTINAKNASGLTIGDIAAQTYTGSAITPTVTVSDGTTTLTDGTDYTVDFSENVNVGTATVTVTGKGNFTGTKTATFSIVAKDVSGFTIASIPEQTYTGAAITPTVTVQDGTTALTDGTDYTVEFSDNINVGTATVTITGKGNYSGTKTATFAIGKAPLTITAKDATMVFGGELPAFEATYDGFINGEDVSVLTKQPAISTEATSSSPSGTYAIIASGAEAQNYAISYVNGTLTIGKRTQTITLDDNLTMTYGDGTFTLPEETEQGLLIDWSSDNATVAAVVGNTLVIKGAGNATLTAEQAGDSNHQPLTKDYMLTVNKAPLTITAQSYTIEQGQSLPTFSATYDGFVNNQTANVLTNQPTFSCEAANSDVPGTYSITPSGAEAKNYEMSYIAGTLTITEQPAVTIMANSYAIKYGDDIPTLEFTTDGGTLSGTPTLSCEATSASPVGTYPITVTKGSVENYNVTYVAGTLTIEKAPLTITADDLTKKQGDPMPTFTATYSGFKNNETDDVLIKQPEFDCSATEASAPGKYDINVSGAEADNYDITFVKGMLTVTDADPVIIMANSYTIKYGDDIPSLEFTADGATLTGTPELACEATPTSPVGTYPITVTKGSVENYNVTYMAGTLTIEKAPLTLTANCYTIEYGSTLPTFEVTYTGFKNNETVDVLTTQPTISCDATSTSPAGSYDINVSDAVAQNYEIIYVNGTLTIGKRSQTITLDDNLVMTYGDGTFTLPEETDQGLLIDWSSDNTEVAAVVGNTLVIKGAGTAILTAEQAGDSNNQPLTKDYMLTVNKAPLTITAQSYTIEQGQSLPTFSATYDGFVNNQTANVLTNQPTFSCEAANSDVPGTYSITPSGAEAKNYEMSYIAGTLTITEQPAVTIMANSYAIKYGDDIPTLEFTTDGGTLSGTPTLSCEATSASPVGTYPITVTKGSVENYNVTYVVGTLTIEKAPLTITAQSYSMVQGEEFPEFEALYDGFKNGETESALKRKPQLATLADEYSGPGDYEIIVSGARSDNYDISYVSGTLTIEPQSGVVTFIAKIPDSSVVLRSKNGEITVEGLADGQRVSIYTYGGMLIGSATAADGKATINASLTPGSIVIVKVGNKTVKYVVR